MEQMSASINKKVVDLRARIWLDDDIFLMNHVPYLSELKLVPSLDLYLVDGLAMIAKSGLFQSIAGIKKANFKFVDLGEYLASLENRPAGTLVLFGGRASPISSKADAQSVSALNRIGLNKINVLPEAFSCAAILKDNSLLSEIFSSVPMDNKFRVEPDGGGKALDINLSISPGGGGVDGMSVDSINIMGAIFGLNIAVYDLNWRMVAQQAAFGSYSAEPGVVITPE